MAESVSQAMVDGVLGDLSQDPEAVAPSFMEMYPRAKASAGLKSLRGTNTILSGGSGVGQRWTTGSKLNPNGSWWGTTREGWAQARYTKPRNWRRFGTQDYFHHKGAMVQPGGKGAVYNPFYAAAGVNWVGRSIMGEGNSKRHLLGKTVAQKLQDKGVLSPGSEVISKGFVSRVSAAGRTMNMSDAAFARHASSLNTFLTGAGYSDSAAAAALKGGQGATAGALLTSGGGSISGRVGGFLSGGTGAHQIGLGKSGKVRTLASTHELFSAQRGQAVARDMFEKIGLDSGKKYTARQMASAGLKAAKGATGAATKLSVAAKGVRLVGARVGMLAIPGVQVVGAALMAKDLAKLATWSVGKVAEVGADTMRAFQGDLKTGILQQSFKDTEATMTSRARGVQAIQNSRLNSRSILGNEAGSMHAHFG